MTLVPIKAFLVCSSVAGCSSQIYFTLYDCACISSALHSRFQMSFLSPSFLRVELDGRPRKWTKNLPGLQKEFLSRIWRKLGEWREDPGTVPEQCDTNSVWNHQTWSSWRGKTIPAAPVQAKHFLAQHELCSLNHLLTSNLTGWTLVWGACSCSKKRRHCRGQEVLLGCNYCFSGN